MAAFLSRRLGVQPLLLPMATKESCGHPRYCRSSTVLILPFLFYCAHFPPPRAGPAKPRRGRSTSSSATGRQSRGGLLMTRRDRDRTARPICRCHTPAVRARGGAAIFSCNLHAVDSASNDFSHRFDESILFGNSWRRGMWA